MPVSSPANVRVEGARPAPGDAATPVPLMLMICGELNALSVITIDATRIPRALGINPMLNVQLPPGARLIPHVFVWEKSLACGPVRLMPAILKAADPVLLKVTIRNPLVTPIGWLAKFTRLGASAAAGAGPELRFSRSDTPERPTATAMSGAPSPLKSATATDRPSPLAPKFSAD